MKKNRGIVLLEVLISVVILSIGISIALQSLAYSVKASQFTSEYIDIQNLLYDKLKEYMGQILPEPGKFQGYFDEPYQNIEWIIEIKDSAQQEDLIPSEYNTGELSDLTKSPNSADDDEILIHLFSFEAQAIWNSKNTPHQVTYSTLLTVVETPDNVIDDETNTSRNEMETDIDEE